MENLLGILSKIGFDWQVALANLVNFLIIFFILKKFAFKPIKKIIDERQVKIEKGLEDAQKAETELMMATEKKNEILNDAKREAGMVMTTAGETRNQILNDAKSQAELAAAEIRQNAEKEIETNRQKLEREIKEKSINLVLNSTEKLIKENMTSEKNEKFIRNILATN